MRGNKSITIFIATLLNLLIGARYRNIVLQDLYWFVASIFHFEPMPKENSLHYKLPAEIFIHIFSFLDVTPLCSIRSVCKLWKTQSDNQTLWKVLTHKYFGIHSIKDDNWKKYFMELYQYQFAQEFITFDPNASPIKNTANVTVVGDAKVGKTIFLMTCLKMLQEWFLDYIPKVISIPKELEIALKETSVKLCLRDTVGDTEYR